jgi:hypothetical protein
MLVTYGASGKILIDRVISRYFWAVPGNGSYYSGYYCIANWDSVRGDWSLSELMVPISQALEL